MECNIGAKGKLARLVTGIMAIGFAMVLGLLIVVGVLSSSLWWYAVASITFGGAFAIFEAKAGWCIVRAIGIKTPL